VARPPLETVQRTVKGELSHLRDPATLGFDFQIVKIAS
jgi:hypothetical protein